MRIIPPKYRRGVRITKYVLLMMAGASTFAAASAVLTSAVGVMVYAWALFLFVGGGLCLLGVITDWWLGEFVGIIPLGITFLMFGAVFIGTGTTESNPGRIAFGWLFLSFLAWVAARWIDIWNLAASSKAANRER